MRRKKVLCSAHFIIMSVIVLLLLLTTVVCIESGNDYDHIECASRIDKHTGKPSQQVFYEQTDYGYLDNIKDGMQTICRGSTSKLKCSKYLLYCKGDNIRIDFSKAFNSRSSLKYSMDVLDKGDIGGKCDTFYGGKLEQNLKFMSSLQSWAPELRHFTTSLEQRCDVTIEKPTYVMKLDAAVNMYHHFCDFFNLFATKKMIGTLNDSDVNILLWENIPYRSNFRKTFDVFTANQILDLTSFGDKNVCFKHLHFSLLPRMVFGLFYNTPIINGCKNSNLFKDFSSFTNEKLMVQYKENGDHKLRVTLLSRQTKYRRILNEDELVNGLIESGKYHVEIAKFSHRTDFLHQLEVVRNTDILIGMHGAGLTHLLFLNDQAGVFELHHCGDPDCYSDLARLRGVHYTTWTDESKVEIIQNINRNDPDYEHFGHKKFANYRFDIEEFLRKVDEAAHYVKKKSEKDEL